MCESRTLEFVPSGRTHLGMCTDESGWGVGLAHGSATGGHDFHGFMPCSWIPRRSRTGGSLVMSPVSPRLCQSQPPWAGPGIKSFAEEACTGLVGRPREQSQDPGWVLALAPSHGLQAGGFS